MQVLNLNQCESVEGGSGVVRWAIAGIIELTCEATKALIASDSNAGQSGGQISDTPAA
ncbi:hypothetical protein [Methylibium rhizosphaerae]|uniref:hypothetical protein n=1 Tax=Methylibium rhizosphaerae TaxID=2570323 RepID=UPI0015E4533E|nr:hypothetical protein [Methylibium rhizosphaerae]